VSWRPAYVTVETGSDRTRGVAVADLLGEVDPPGANCRIGLEVDADGFRRHFLDRIATLP
jgi:inosine-uridine nucleoside N-ribohydrolase